MNARIRKFFLPVLISRIAGYAAEGVLQQTADGAQTAKSHSNRRKAAERRINRPQFRPNRGARNSNRRVSVFRDIRISLMLFSARVQRTCFEKSTNLEDQPEDMRDNQVKKIRARPPPRAGPFPNRPNLFTSERAGPDHRPWDFWLAVR